MAPPTMAPPMMPPATAAPRPRWAEAGVTANVLAIAATATKAANDFFMSWALLGMMAPSRQRRFQVTHTLYLKPTVSLKSAHQPTQSKRSQNLGPKNGFFRPRFNASPKTCVSGDALRVCNEDERLSRTPGCDESASRNRPRSAGAASSSRRGYRRRRRARHNRRDGRNSRVYTHNSPFNIHSSPGRQQLRRQRWRRRSIRQRSRRPDIVGHG